VEKGSSARTCVWLLQLASILESGIDEGEYRACLLGMPERATWCAGLAGGGEHLARCKNEGREAEEFVATARSDFRSEMALSVVFPDEDDGEARRLATVTRTRRYV
jgi:hypothetical protein